MNIRITPSVTCGEIRAIASKSVAHRIAICAAFAKNETRILCQQTNEDIEATLRCLVSLGARIKREGQYITVSPVETVSRGALLDCGESGSTMRFLIPVAALLGADASFLMSGRLPERPLSPLREELERCGIVFSETGSNPLICKGEVSDCEFFIRGDVSSQFISGLMLALAVSGRQGRVNIEGELQSAPYIEITADVIRSFGATVSYSDGAYEIDARGGLVSDGEMSVEGDWSAAAFSLCLGAIGRDSVTVSGLCKNSRQGDRRIIEILQEMGACVEWQGESVKVSPSPLHGIRIDGSQIPDLIPALAVVCALAEGESVIYNAERLRIKESDRLHAIYKTLGALGADIVETADGLRIFGMPCFMGGEVMSFGDHRIVMSAAIASVRCTRSVTVFGVEAVAKSYPSFFEDMSALGMICESV